ncbi:MAG: bifunctional metallophosphatase/5'-nucleotidase [Alphaproteobacteria bacterium]|nr:bifunctional metallophosphatase/5'-nucleotidase [Alphaproteobacteria bacterium]
MRTAQLLLVSLAFVGCKKSGGPARPSEPRVLHIAALNDFHGGLYEQPKYKEPGRALGGLPWLSGALDALRAEHPDLLVLDGGDVFQGSWPVNATKGRGAVEAFNLMGVDAAAVGNHEFDYGGLEGEHPKRGALERGGRLAEYAWLSANIRDAGGNRWSPEGFLPWTVIERSGVKVGVIGLSTQDTPQTTLFVNVADLTFEDVVQTVRDAVPKMREAGAEVIVAVGHLTGKCDPVAYDDPGEPCTPDGEVGRLLTELEPGTLDVLIAGHAHTLLHHRVRDTFVLEQRAYGHAIGRLDLVVGPDGVDVDASVIHPAWFLEHDPVDPGCTDAPFPTAAIDVGGRQLAPDPEAIALVERLEAEAGSLCDEVGCTTEELGRDRGGESAVGDLVADAMLAAMDGVDIAITNAGGLRANLPAGTIRREHLQAVMPFDNRLVRLEMTGAQLDRLLHIGSSGAHGMLQVAGLAYGFDPALTAGTDLNGDGTVEGWETRRLCDGSVTVGGAALDPARTYSIVTTDFLFGGGDHLGPAFEGLSVLEEGPLLRDAMNTWFEAQDTCVAPNTTPRITAGGCAG